MSRETARPGKLRRGDVVLWIGTDLRKNLLLMEEKSGEPWLVCKSGKS
jgi:hypothetical protein